MATKKKKKRGRGRGLKHHVKKLAPAASAVILWLLPSPLKG